MSEPWSITLRSASDQVAFDHLRAVLTKTLGLDWRATAGQPDGWEIAEECAEALWDAGFRIPDAPPRPASRESEQAAAGAGSL